MIRAGIAALLAGLALAGAPVRAGAASGAGALPPYAGLYQPSTVDERGLWMKADEYERQLRDSAFVIRDAALNAYVRGVFCRTVGPDRCAAVRLYVMRVPQFNATMMPNGALQIWSGLLLRVRSEAELAGILGHEFAHFERRHGLGRLRHGRVMTDIASWAGVLGGVSGLVVQTQAIGSIFTHSRADESEADLLGARYGAAAGYDARALPAIWMRLMDEADATALGRRQRSHRYDRVSFFASHPTSAQRAADLRAAAAALPPGGESGDQRLVGAIAPWRSAFLEDQLKLNDFEGTDVLLRQIAEAGWSEDLLFARAELYRGRGHPRDLVAAADLYRQAIGLNADHPESWRGLGLALLRGGQVDEGRQALRHYLAARPDAADASMLAALLT